MTDLSESEFERLAGQTLEGIADILDSTLGDGADVDFSGGILTCTLDSGGQYVLNRHTPNRQIWLSSPRSGASHYAFDVGRAAWADTRTGRTLTDVLVEELGGAAKGRLAFA